MGLVRFAKGPSETHFLSSIPYPPKPKSVSKIDEFPKFPTSFDSSQYLQSSWPSRLAGGTHSKMASYVMAGKA